MGAGLLLLLLLLLPLLQHSLGRGSGSSGAEWVNHGGDILNHRSAVGPNIQFNNATLSKLGLKWRFLIEFNVSATPSISKDGMIYFPDWNGNLYALKSKNGHVIWEKNLTEVVEGLYPGTLSRTTPVIHKQMLLVGLLGPPVVLALDRFRGTLIWQSQPLDTASGAQITMSGTTFEGFYFVGVSSSQEVIGPCCTFQGSFQKLKLNDGTVVWKTLMVPEESEYYGVAVWGSSPAIDENRRLVYIGTGNNYDLPTSVEECDNNRSNSSITTEPDPCISSRNHQDALVALNVDSGDIVWSKSLQAYDVWTLACQLSPATPNCPLQLGPDYDFGEAPMLLYFNMEKYGERKKNKQCLVVAGQKSGVVWALDCDNGSTIWSTVAGPGGSVGGASWGMCTDGERVYTNIINNLNREFVLSPSNSTTIGGGWVGLDGRTGDILWSTPEPTEAYTPGPVSCTNGLVFATSFTANGYVYALDALSGSILWHGATYAHIYGGFSIDKDCIYGGNGYPLPLLLPTTKVGVFVSAFCLK